MSYRWTTPRKRSVLMALECAAMWEDSIADSMIAATDPRDAKWREKSKREAREYRAQRRELAEEWGLE